MTEKTVYDCIIVGAGPGGLQAAIYLGRYNRKVLLIDRGGGRTWHARRIENFLTQKMISGKEIIERGIEQARGFHVSFEKGLVTAVSKGEYFEVTADEKVFSGRFVIVSTGGTENLPHVENIHRFLGAGFYTCIDCDGYHTTGKKLVILGNSLKTVHLAFGMKEMYTKDITLILYFLQPPEHYQEELREEGIVVVNGRPQRIIGEDSVEGIELQDGRVITCEAIMSNLGYKLNDDFLSGLNLKRDAEGFKYVTGKTYESSLSGLYIVGPLTGNDQVVIAAGEGAMAAIDIKKRLLEL
ncbi:MAG: NAD(P)/FAD-dependent oxidoreductase [Nitrospiraceae bacterium]|nr:NAD(P)/FAD-dependent oxidoreductase [Nitrospiraceae bacterium]